MATKIEENDWTEPKRDARGRFRRGSTGNAKGRPPKQPEVPWELQRSIAEALTEKVIVTEGSVKISLEMRDLLVKTLVRNAAKAKPTDLLRILGQLLTMGAFETVPSEVKEDSIFTEEDRRLLEIIQKEIDACEENICDNCLGLIKDCSSAGRRS
jgi:hypothetical protein